MRKEEKEMLIWNMGELMYDAIHHNWKPEKWYKCKKNLDEIENALDDFDIRVALFNVAACIWRDNDYLSDEARFAELDIRERIVARFVDPEYKLLYDAAYNEAAKRYEESMNKSL